MKRACGNESSTQNCLSRLLTRQDKSDEGAYTPRDFADWREIPSEALERSEFRTLLTKALASLGQKYREVFLLRDVAAHEHRRNRADC